MGLEKITEIRKAKGISLEELSVLSGVPISTIKKISAGITKKPSIETVKSIVYALESTLDDLDDEPNLYKKDTKKEPIQEDGSNIYSIVFNRKGKKNVIELTEEQINALETIANEINPKK